MRAFALNSYGPDTLALSEVQEPEVRAGQVKISVEQIAVNPLDGKIRNGYLADLIPLALPAVIGTDVAGRVIELGEGVDDLAVGDRVAGFADSGAFASIAVTGRARLTRVPDALDLERAVALVTSAETAQRVLAMLTLKPGSTVVVNGAAGSVGSAVVQLLVAAGHAVVGTAGEGSFGYLRELGAQPVHYDRRMLDELGAFAPRAGLDAAVDTAGEGFISRIAPLLDASRIVTIVDFAAAAQGAIVAGGNPLGLTAETVGAVLELAAADRFRVEIAGRYPFEQIPEALTRSESGHVRGKLVVAGVGIDPVRD